MTAIIQHDQLNSKRLSTVSTLRRMEMQLRQIAENLADDTFLSVVPYQNLQPIENNVHAAHLSVVTLLHSIGDAVVTSELPLRSKKLEHDRDFKF